MLLPEDVAAKAGYDVVIADSVNHRLRGLSLADGTATTLVGNGVQRLLETGPARVDEDAAGFTGQLSGHPLEVSLSSPWDVVWSAKLNAVVVAMAGTHQIFSFDPLTGAVAIMAGNGLEGLLDGAAHEAWFAQPSGLAEDADGNIWVADSETSALRKLAIDDDGTVTVETAVGKGLFDFGFRDGEAAEARLQHPLGVTVLPDGSVAIADTYNGAVRRYDPAAEKVSTLARGLSEPSDVIVDHTQAAGSEPLLVVVEANKHQLVYVPIPKEAQQVDEGASQTHRPKSPVAPGLLELTVRFTAPTGQKLDDRWGDPTQLKISSTPPELLVAGGGTSVGLLRTLELASGHSRGRPAHHRPRRGLRRPRKRGRRDSGPRRLPPVPAGLGHPRPADGRRRHRAGPGPARHGLTTAVVLTEKAASRDIASREAAFCVRPLVAQERGDLDGVALDVQAGGEAEVHLFA